MKDLKYILKRVIIGILLFIIIGSIKSCEVSAQVVLDGTTLGSSNFKVVNEGNRVITFQNMKVYPMSQVPEFFVLTFCSDTQRIRNWTLNNYTLRSANFFDTNYKCMFPNSGYSGGHVVYLYGTYDISTACGSGTTSCLPGGKITFYEPNQSSWALLSYEDSIASINIDYASQSLITGNTDLINKQQELIDLQNRAYNLQQEIKTQNNNTYNMQLRENNETQEKLDGVNSSINNLNSNMSDSSTDDPSGSINSSKDKIASNNTITQLVLLPVNLYTKVLSTIDGSCSTYNLGELLGHSLILPCINVATYIGSATWGIIDIIISGMLIYAISRKFVKVFNELSQMKEGDIID